MTRIRFDGCDLSPNDRAPRYPKATIDPMPEARYDAAAEWYETFKPALPEHERAALGRLLGPGTGRCLDLGCGSGVAIPVLAELGWTVVGVDPSEEMLRRARTHGAEVVRAFGDELPFEDESFDAAVSIWTHTDMDDFAGAVREVARVLRPQAPFVYLGAHPCFIGPHSRFAYAQGVPSFHLGYYRRSGRYDNAPGISPDGLRARVGATHLPLDRLIQAFADAEFRIERFEELELSDRDYPYMVALCCRL